MHLNPFRYSFSGQAWRLKTTKRHSHLSGSISDSELRKNTELYGSIVSEGNADGVSIMMSPRSRPLLTKPEVLSPAGGWPQLQAACENGADAVYFGLDLFSARARASNFTLDELPEVCSYLRERGVKGFVAMNVLVFDNELAEVEERIRAMAEAGVDAVIVQDLGVVHLMRRVAPNLPVHGSTQMSITSAEGASFAASLGIDRVVVGRELSISEIASVRSKVKPNNVEVEAFVHGALCVSYSGQCFSSEAWGGRSANRGACAQACRLPYALIANGEIKEMGDEKYLLSPQDLMAVELVPDLILAGVSCFKIEGRLKGPEYVSITTRAYRQAVDKAWEVLENNELLENDRLAAAKEAVVLDTRDRSDLEQVFSRGQSEDHRGLTTGFLEGPRHQMLVRGRNPRHRGQLLGRVTHVEEQPGFSNGEMVISAWISELLSPLSLDNGIVFDSGEPEGDEVGGQVKEVSYFITDQMGKRKKVILQPNKGGSVLPGKKQVKIKIAYSKRSKVNNGDLVWKTKDYEVEARLKASWNLPAREKRKSLVNVSVSGKVGAKLEIVLTDDSGRSSCASSPSDLQLASKRRLTQEDIEAIIGSLGDNALDVSSLDTSSLELGLGLFLPLSELKATRREAVECFLQLKMKHGRDAEMAKEPTLPSLLSSVKATPSSNLSDECKIRLLCRTKAQVEAACEVPWLEEIIVDFLEVQGLKEAVNHAKKAGKVVVVATPRVLKPDEERLWIFYLKLEADKLLIRSLGFVEKMIELGGPGAVVPMAGANIKIPELEGDFSLNAANVLSADLLLNRGLSKLALTHDLNSTQLCDLARSLGPRSSALEAIVHTHLPIFHTEHCVFCRFLSSGNSYKDCGHPCETQNVHLRDSQGLDHLVLADMGCRNTVFNAQAQSGLFSIGALISSGYKSLRIELCDEPADIVAPLVEAYREAAGLHGGAKRSPTETWRWLQTLPDANGRTMGVSSGSLGASSLGINKTTMKATASQLKVGGGAKL